MKFEKNKKYFTIAVYAFLVIAASILFFFIMQDPDKILGVIGTGIAALAPIIVGFGIAFVLNPVLNFFENTVFKKLEKKKRKRALSILCTYVVFLGVISLFISFALPALISSVKDLVNNLDQYYEKGTVFFQSLSDTLHIPDSFSNMIGEWSANIITFIGEALSAALPKLVDLAAGVTTVLKNTFVGFVFSIYMLASKEIFKAQFIRIIKTFTKKNTQNRLFRIGSISYETFSSYISGYLVDSTIVGLITFIVMTIFSWPYPALIAIIIGVTNMIPFFGPIIGAIPSAFLILLVNPWQAVFFAIFILILQQVEGNIICPRILGHSIGLKPFWVMVAIVVGSSLFGIAGMLIGVPTFAVIYTLMRSYLARKSHEKEELEKAEN